eukprot:g67303.t1
MAAARRLKRQSILFLCFAVSSLLVLELILGLVELGLGLLERSLAVALGLGLLKLDLVGLIRSPSPNQRICTERDQGQRMSARRPRPLSEANLKDAKATGTEEDVGLARRKVDFALKGVASAQNGVTSSQELVDACTKQVASLLKEPVAGPVAFSFPLALSSPGSIFFKTVLSSSVISAQVL